MGGQMKILNECSFLTEDGISKIEEKYNAKYVLEACIKDANGQWANMPCAIFYSEVAHPQGSNYFALYYSARHNTYMITNGLSAVDGVEFNGIESEGEVVYSRYRHDFRKHKNGAFIDGGRDYGRFGGDTFNDYNHVKFVVNQDRLEII
jgi:hypothetical protein